MLKIEIRDGAVHSATVNGKNGQFQTRSQEGWVQLPNGEVRKLRVRLDRDFGGYAQGVYAVSDQSFSVGEYGDLVISQLRLEKVAVGTQPAVRPAG